VGVVCRAVERVDQGQEGLRIRSGRRPWALKSHMNRLGACEYLDGWRLRRVCLFGGDLGVDGSAA